MGVCGLRHRPYICDNKNQKYIQMKYSLLLILGLLSHTMYAQTCFPDGITLTSQQEIDDFASNYPDCSTIEGKLTISESVENDITNLLGLSQITRCDRGLKVANNKSLATLEGLENVVNVRKRLEITNLENLTSIEAISNLRSDNGVNVFIISNPILSTLDGLDFEVLGDLTLAKNHMLEDLTGLENLVELHVLSLTQNDNIVSLEGLSSLTTVNSSIRFLLNKKLENMNGLEGVESIGRSLELSNNRMINDISGLRNVETIESTILIGSTLLTNLNSLQNLRVVSGQVRIGGNSLLTDISALENLDPYRIGTKDILNPNTPMLNIQNNPLLSQCSIESFCYFLNRADIVTKIMENGVGCNTVSEISADCDIPQGSCFPSGLILSNQMDIDSFASNNPNCNIIGGDLTITGINITSLLGLSIINNVVGSLIIKNNNQLTTLEGLGNITQLNGGIEITENNLLQNLNGIHNIDPSTIMATGTDLALNISNNPALTECHIETICDYLDQPGNILIEENAGGCNSETEIVDACILAATSCLIGNTTFSSQHQIDEFALSYPGCSVILGNLTIKNTDVDSITNLDGLSSIVSVGESFIIENTSLTSLSGLDNITSIGGLRISDNKDLENMDALGNLENIGNFILRDNAKLTHLADMQSVTSLETLELFLNPLLENVDGLSSVEICNRDFSIRNCGITNLDGLSSLTTLQRGINLTNNDQLTNIDGLSNLSYIEKNVIISTNSMLQSIQGLSGLSSTSGSIQINNNDILQTLQGLEFLDSISGNIIITDNDILSNIDGIVNIDPSTITASNPNNNKAIEIINNPNLSTCDISNICALLIEDSTDATIENNGINCNTIDDVLISCTTAVSNTPDVELLSIYPNPTNQLLYIDSPIKGNIEIFNARSILMEKSAVAIGVNTLDLTSYPRGIYFVRSGHGFIAKVVKL